MDDVVIAFIGGGNMSEAVIAYVMLIYDFGMKGARWTKNYGIKLMPS